MKLAIAGLLLAISTTTLADDLTFNKGYTAKLCIEDTNHIYTLWAEDEDENLSLLSVQGDTVYCAAACLSNQSCAYDIPDNTTKIVMFYTVFGNSSVDFDPETDSGKLIACSAWGATADCEYAQP